MPKKSFKFVLNKRGDIIIFNLSFVLLSAKIDPIVKKQNHKRDAFGTCGISYVKIIFALPAEVIVLYI